MSVHHLPTPDPERRINAGWSRLIATVRHHEKLWTEHVLRTVETEIGQAVIDYYMREYEEMGPLLDALAEGYANYHQGEAS